MKFILLTGCTKGIGLAIAKQLISNESYHVVGTGRDPRFLSPLLKYRNFDFFICDLSDQSQIDDLVCSIDTDLFAIINNAGICQVSSLQDKNPDPYSTIMQVNVNAPYSLVKQLSSCLIDNGRVVNISSQLGVEGRAGYSAYCASKFALIGMTKCWAKELGGRGITVNAICPGWVETEMSVHDVKRLAEIEGVSYEEYYAKICSPLELKRFTKPEEVSSLVAYLLSNGASGITGRDWLLNTIWNQE